MVYGEHAGHYAEGEWTEAATDLLQREGWMSKHKAMATLTEKVQSVFVARATTPHAACRFCFVCFTALSLLTAHYSLLTVGGHRHRHGHGHVLT